MFYVHISRHHSRSRGISVVPRPPTLPKGKDLKQWLSEQTASDHYLDADLLLKPPKDDNLLEDDEAELEHDQRLAQEEKELLAAFANSEKDDDREIDARYPLPPEPQREIDGIEDIPFDDVLEKQQVMTAFRSFLQAKIRANPNQYKQCKDDWEFLDAVQRWRRTAFAGSSGKFDTGKLLGEKLYMTYLDTSNKNKPPIITITDKMKWRILARLGKLGDGKQEEDEDEPPPPPPPDDDDAPPGPPDSDDSPAESSDEESYAPPPPRGAYKAQGPSKYTPTPNNKSTTSQTLPEHEIRTLAREGVTQETFTEVTQMVWNRFVKTISKEFLASPEYKKLNDGQRRVGDDKYKSLYDEWKYKYEYMLDKRTRMKAERAEARRIANEARERRRKQIRAERAAIKEARSERERLAAEEAKRKREKEEEAQRMAALAEKRKKQKEFVEKLKEEAAREARHESSSEDEDRWLELQDFDGSDDEKKKKKKKEKKAPPPDKRGSAMLTGAQISGPVITSPPRAGLIPIVKRSSGIIVSRDSNASDTPRTKHSVSRERDDEDGDDEAEEEDDDDDDEDMDDYDTEDDDDDEADDDPEVQAEKAKRRAKKEQLAALEGGADMDAMTKLKALGALGANLVKAKLAGMKAVEDDTNNGMFTRKRDDAMDDDTTISSPRGKIDIDDDDRPDPNFQVPKGESRFNIKTMAGPHGMSKPQGWYNYKKWKCVCFELKQFRGKLSGDVNTIYCHINVDSQEFKTKAETSKVWNEHMEFYLLDTTQWIEVTVYRSDGVILGFAMIPIVDVTKRSADDAPMWVNLLPPPMDQLSKAPVRSVNIELELHCWLSKKYPKDHGYKQVRHIETEERSAVADKIRMLVSKKKKRFKQDGFDLDLSYITPSVIAMGYPSTGHEGIYRNPLKDVQRFFLKRHSQAYKLYNLCSERQYSADKFEQSVGCYPFDDHNPPPFELIAKFCEDVRTWLSDHPQNVVAIHCKAGKGRTGTVIACYLVYARVCPNAQAALDYFAARRTKNKKGVTIPSQMRYVHYFDMWCNIKIHGGLAPGPTTLFLTSITLSGLPTNCRSEQLFFTMMMIPENSGRVKYNSFGKIIPNVEQGFDRGLPYEHITFDLHRKLFALSEDFHFAFFKKTNAGKAKLFAFWLNSRWETLHAFDFKGIASDHFHLILYKKELDKAIKDKKHRTFTADFRIQLTFQATPVATYIKQKELVDVVKQIKQESGGAEVSTVSAASTTATSTPSKSNLKSSSPSSGNTTASARPSPMALGKAADGSKPVQTLIPIKALPGRNDLVKIGGLPTASKFVVNTGNGVK